MVEPVGPTPREQAEAAPARLVGRDSEVTAARAVVEAACSGSPQVLLVQGAAGIGKTSVLKTALRTSDVPHPSTVLHARCRELWRDTSYGVVRDLMAPLDLVGRGASALSPAARWALPVLAESTVDSGPPDSSRTYTSMHGLYWLAVDLMARGPLVLAIDDVQWADERSAHWLAYLLRRTRGMLLCLTLTMRTPGTSAVAAVLGDALQGGGFTVLTLDALPRAAVAELIAGELGRVPDEGFVSECVDLSAGNPLTLSRLLRGSRRPFGPAGRSAPLDVVASSVFDWLADQPGHVARVCRAVAVLERTDTDLVAALSGVPGRTVETTLTLLRGNDILDPTGDGFVHDLIRGSLLADLDPVELVAARTLAARLLNDFGTPAEEIAAHLLRLPSQDEPWMRAVLAEAATDAERRGAPEAAIRYLECLLANGSDDVNRRTRLAGLLAQTRPAAALDHLYVALDRAGDVRSGVRVAMQFASTALAVQQSPTAVAVLGRALEEFTAVLGNDPAVSDRELLHLARAVFVMSGMDEKQTVPLVRAYLSEVEEPAGETPAERHLLAMMAVSDMMEGQSPELAVRRAKKALRVGEATCGGWSALASTLVLDNADEGPAALAAVDRVIAQSRADGAVWTYSLALGTRAVVLGNMGDFTEACSDVRLALEVARQEAWHANTIQPTVGMAVWLVHQGEARGADELLANVSRPRLDDFVLENHYYRMARAQTRAGLGDVDGAVDHLLWCGRSLAEAGITTPLFVPWWADVALLLAEHGRGAEAVAHVEHGEHLVRSWGVPRARGLELLARAAVSEGPAAVELLQEAVHVFEGSPSAYDRQRAEHRLGLELLRRGDARSARRHLRLAVDLATRCGSRVAATRSRDLLVKAGGRLRPMTGASEDVLTSSEQRVAGMAVDGLTNREIAEALFVTPRTVEVHLTSAYRKLGIGGRAQLANALGATRPRRDRFPTDSSKAAS
ncbi:MAG: AAA family ATPase [Umezawaea sp.]